MATGMNINHSAGSATPPSWTLTAQRRDRKTWTTLRERVDADVAVLRLTSVELEDILKQLHAVALPNARIRSEVRLSVCHLQSFAKSKGLAVGWSMDRSVSDYVWWLGLTRRLLV